MDLLEYQAKELFHQVGIPILPSQPINDPSELKRLHIPYPVVLKSQVRAGGRGRAGGIRFVENTIDAIAATRAIFNLPIMGEYPQVILAEARYNAQEEFFLAVLLDYQLQCPVLMGSVKGGMDIEALLQNMQTVVVEENFSPFYARRLAIKMGLQGKLIQAISTIVEKIYALFQDNDLDVIEINPLGVSADGEVMALDGKISVNDAAIARHPDLLSLTATRKITLEVPADINVANTSRANSALLEPQWLEGLADKGTIGIISNSWGLALATWDLIIQEQGKLAGCAVLDECSANIVFEQQLEIALEEMMAKPSLKVILINILSSSEMTQTAAQAIADHLQPQLGQMAKPRNEDRLPRATGTIASARDDSPKYRSSQPTGCNFPAMVIRLVGGELTPYKEQLALLPVHWTEELEEAISQTLSLAKAK